MSNSYFQFKQFTIHQDQCAMKVSTDACIQGAWTPVTSSVKTVLDIGTGTGLLSLMLAQRSEKAVIDAIELEPSAATQAKENFSASPWSNRINVLVGDVCDMSFRKKYDLVICNPPFFNNSLLGDKEERNKARHTLSLSFDDLFHVISNNLGEDGYASILLPVAEHMLWKQIVEKNNWTIFHRLNIIPRVGLPANRVVSLCSAKATRSELFEDLIIRDSTNSYTPEFINLMQPFYLKL